MPYERGQRPIHLVSAHGAGLGAVLGQVRTAGKPNEITAIPELLEALCPSARRKFVDCYAACYGAPSTRSIM